MNIFSLLYSSCTKLRASQNATCPPEPLISELCETCRRIDFASLVWRTVLPGEPTKKMEKIQLGCVQDVRSRSHVCELCRTIANRLSHISGGSGIKQHPDDQCVLTTRKLDEDAEVNWSYRSQQDGSVAAFNMSSEPHFSAYWLQIEIKPATTSKFHGPVLPDQYFKTGEQNASTGIGTFDTRPWILMSLQACTHPIPDVDLLCNSQIELLPPPKESKFSGRIRKSQINLSLPLHWLQLCQKFHGHGCWAGKHHPAINCMKVIDVRNLAIVPAPDPCEYVALSYCWGSANTYKLTRENVDKLEMPHALSDIPLPNTISDAILVTRSSRIKYLWVDALCIVQDDLEIMSSHLLQMARIYKQAMFTIIAASAQNSDEGLAGVRPDTRSVLSNTIRLSSLSLIATPEDPTRNFHANMDKSGLLRNSLDALRWRSRAWTFQEELFSQRRVYFESDRMFWVCECNIFHEETVRETPMHRKKTASYRALSFELGLNVLQTDAELHWDVYDLLIRNYTRRQLSFKSDSINAISGTMRELYGFRGHKVIWGHPQRWFVRSLIWGTNSEKAQHHAHSTEILKNGEDLHVPFPSWSWSAWIGEGNDHMFGVGNPDESLTPFFYQCFLDKDGSHIPLACINGQKASSGSLKKDFCSVQDKTWVGSPRHVALPLVEPFENMIDSGILKFWTSRAVVYIMAEDTSMKQREFEYRVVSHTSKILDHRANIQSLSSFFWDDETRYEMYPPAIKDAERLSKRGTHQIDAVFLGGKHLDKASSSGHLYILLVEEKDSICYRRGICEVLEKNWIELKPIWSLVTLG